MTGPLILSEAMRAGTMTPYAQLLRTLHRERLAARKRALGETIRYLEETLGKRSRSKALSSARGDILAVNNLIFAMGAQP
jgi:hypothetical protein